MIGFALCHGWSFDARCLYTIAASLCARFPQAAIATFDLGFTGRLQAPALHALAQDDTQWIALGHSYGFAYLMQQPIPWHGAISVNGFTRFCRHPGKPEGTLLRLLDAMLARLEAEPLATIEDFRQRCGSKQAISQPFDLPLLDMHLKQLRGLDLPLPSCPVLSLSTSSDLIVPPALTHACFGETAHTTREYEGSHVQLLQEPQACMAAIAEFAEAIRE